ncbi:MAG: Teichuronic acid biosynthesis protein TuaB [Steroidobacteraceae bacterium]|nr:Teichuronic acid biosynthesis protein TuaB [Steroidobacteraceae bacterium]
MSSIERRALVALKWASIAKLTGQLASWASTLVVMRLLNPEAYGLMALVSVVISVLGNIAELGIGAAVVQARDIGRDDLGKISGLILLVNGALFATLVLGAPLVSLAYGEPELTALIQVAALQLPISAIATIQQALAQRELDFKWLAWVELSTILATAAVTLLLAWFGFGVWALVLGTVANAIVRAAVVLQRGFVWPSFRLRGVGQYLRVGGAVTIGRVLWQVIYQTDVLIGGHRLGAGPIGVYSVSLQLATLPLQKIMMTLNQIALPAVARLQDEPERLRRRMIDATRLLTVLSVPALWGLSAVAPELVHVILGPKWSEAVLPIQFIALVAPLRMVSATFATAAVGMGRVGLDIRNNMQTAIVLPIAFFIGTYWGVNGLAAAWLFAVPLLFALNVPRMAGSVSVGLSDIVRALIRPVVAGAVMFAAVAGGRATLDFAPGLLRLVVLIGIGAISYLGTLHWLQPGIWSELRSLARAARS